MNMILYKNCDKKLSGSDTSCPNCGSENKTISLSFHEKMDIHDSINSKVKDSQNKLKYHCKSGDSFFRKTQQWNYLVRIIDWTKNYYKELITDKNGKIIRDIEEPLSKHQGRGSAKYKK